MHLRTLIPALLLSASCLACQAAPAKASGKQASPFPVEEVVAQVKRELATVQNSAGAGVGLKLEKVTLAFTLTQTKDANGKISVGIPGIEAEIGVGGHVAAEDTSSLTIELAPPASGVTMSIESAGSLGLAEAILAVRQQLTKGLNEEPRLDPRKVEVTVKYALTRDGGPSGKFKFLVVSAEAGAKLSAAKTQSVSLSFGRAAP